MASRRKLKKTVQFAADELMENVLFKTLLADKDILAKADKILVKISEMSTEFGKRAGKPNKEAVKKHYQKMFEDWNSEVEKIMKEVEKL